MAEIATLIGGVSSTPGIGKKAHTAAVEAGEVIVINGNACVAVNKKGADEDNAYVTEGPIKVKKTSGLAINFGDIVYWDAAAEEMNKTPTSNTEAGYCLEDAATTDADVVMYLKPNDA